MGGPAGGSLTGALDAFAAMPSPPFVAVVVDAGGRIVEAHQGWGDRDASALLGIDPADLGPPRHRAATQQRIRSVLRRATPATFDVPVVAGDRTLWFQTCATPLGPVGAASGALLVAFDVTDRHAEEERLRRAERMMVDTEGVAHFGTWEWDITEPHARWSEELFRIYGLDPRTHTPSYEDYLTRVHPEDRDRVMKATEGVYQHLQPYSHDERVYRPDGELRHLHTWAYPMVDTDGKLERLVGVCQDITDRVKAEEKFSQLLESAPDAMVIVGRDGGIQIVNRQAEALFGYARQELFGKPIEALIPERFRQAHVQHREGYFAKPHARPMGADLNLSGRRKDGTEFPVEVSLSPIHTPEGIMVTAAVRDVTARREAEARLRASLEEKEVLLREVHHRVKNNLQVVSSLLKLQAAQAKDERARQAFEENRGRVRSMALVHEILYQSKSFDQIDLDAYLGRLTREVARAYNVAPGVVELETQLTPLKVDLDVAINVGLVLNELLSNAMKYAFPDGRRGRVRVTLDKGADGGLALAVSDDGVGLPDGFDPATSETLGMSLVDTLCRQMGGRLEVSGPPGAAFHVTLPPSTKGGTPHAA